MISQKNDDNITRMSLSKVEIRWCTPKQFWFSGLPTVDTVSAIYRAQSALVSLIPIDKGLGKASHYIQGGLSLRMGNSFAHFFSKI